MARTTHHAPQSGSDRQTDRRRMIETIRSQEIAWELRRDPAILAILSR